MNLHWLLILFQYVRQSYTFNVQIGSLRSYKLQAVIEQSDYKLLHCSTPTTYVLRPETRHHLQQSAQYDTFLSRALGQCFTRVAKMRRNTLTPDDGNWTIANLETCSFIRLNNAFRKNFAPGGQKENQKINRPQKTTSILRADFKQDCFPRRDFVQWRNSEEAPQ